jgi:hypothetical protein
MSEMWLRVVLFDCDRPGDAATLDYMRSSITETIGRLRAQGPGFKGGQWGHDPEAGTLAAVTHWASRDGIRAAEAELAALSDERREQGVRPRSVTNLRVLAMPSTWDQADWQAVHADRTDTWLRVALYRPERQDDPQAMAYLRESTNDAVRMLNRCTGFRIGFWGHDPVEGTMAAVTYWDSLESIKGAAAELEQLHGDRAAHGIATDVIANIHLFPTPVIEQGEPQGYVAPQRARTGSRQGSGA